MIHISTKAKELMDRLYEQGFNGIQFDSCRLCGSDKPEEGEQTAEEKANEMENYCVFDVEPAFPILSDERPYVESHFDESRFWRDFRDMLFEEFGDDVTIASTCRNREWEVSRKTDKPFNHQPE